jgi:predicted RNA methylase
MEPWTPNVEFERVGAVRRALKKLLINPAANYLPVTLTKALLRFGKSQLAAANWKDPGGWESMVISYDGQPHQVADKILVKAGSMSMALRNRKRLGSRLLARLIDEAPGRPAHALCIGAGPGMIILSAMAEATREAHATLVDINSDPFAYGLARAREMGLANRVRFVQCDAREVDEVKKLLERPPDIVKMLGICEYLDDAQVLAVAGAAAKVMADGAAVVFNSLSKAHGTDRFFRRVFGLHMIHRTPSHLQSLMEQAGFCDFVSFAEPLGVYEVIVGRRKGTAADRTKGAE